MKAKVRNALPSSAFGLPDQRKYPVEKIVNGKVVPDRAHAANAKSRAAANAIPAQKAKIDAKANRVLKETDNIPKGKCPTCGR
jgi:hypothetical protein